MFAASRMKDELNNLKDMLPGDHPAPVVKDDVDEMRFEIFNEFMDHHEFEIALDGLIYIAECHIDFGNKVQSGFWEKAAKIAKKMEMYETEKLCNGYTV